MKHCLLERLVAYTNLEEHKQRALYKLRVRKSTNQTLLWHLLVTVQRKRKQKMTENMVEKKIILKKIGYIDFDLWAVTYKALSCFLSENGLFDM